MYNKQVVRLINAIRNTHPDMEDLFRTGQCYNFFLILRSVFPQAVAWYSMREGHVYVEIDGYYYDIRGYHLTIPDDLEVLDHNRGDKPHRWGSRDFRRLVPVGVINLTEKRKQVEKELRAMYWLVGIFMGMALLLIVIGKLVELYW